MADRTGKRAARTSTRPCGKMLAIPIGGFPRPVPPSDEERVEGDPRLGGGAISGAGAGEQRWAPVGGVAGAVLVARAGNQVELAGRVEAGTLVGVAGAHEGRLFAGSDIDARAVG